MRKFGLVLALGTLAALSPFAQASGGTEVALTKKNVLLHVLNSKELAVLVASDANLKTTDFRSVTAQRDSDGKNTEFTLFMEYEKSASLRDLNCTFEAHVSVKGVGPSAVLPAPAFTAVECSE